MSLPFLAGCAIAFVVLVVIAERWSVLAAGALVLVLGALLACSTI